MLAKQGSHFFKTLAYIKALRRADEVSPSDFLCTEEARIAESHGKISDKLHVIASLYDTAFDIVVHLKGLD